MQGKDAAELLIRALGQFGLLSDEDGGVLRRTSLPVRKVTAGQDLIGQGAMPTSASCWSRALSVATGWLGTGGDRPRLSTSPAICAACTACCRGHRTTASPPSRRRWWRIPHATVLEWMKHPGLRRLLWQVVLVEGTVFREWVVNVGRRPAIERLAHLLCEIVTRLAAVGLVRNARCALPLTQAELADATALSAVLANRSLQELRGQGLIELRNGTLALLDWNGLKRLAGFDPAYLHQVAMAA